MGRRNRHNKAQQAADDAADGAGANSNNAAPAAANSNANPFAAVASGDNPFAAAAAGAGSNPFAVPSGAPKFNFGDSGEAKQAQKKKPSKADASDDDDDDDDDDDEHHGADSDSEEEELPPHVAVQIEHLKSLEAKHDEIHKQFELEKRELERKYEKLYQVVYDERNDVITGRKQFVVPEAEPKIKEIDDAQPPAAATGAAAASADADAPKAGELTKGIKDFWLTVLENSNTASHFIEDYDRPILSHLIDIGTATTDEGFKVFFTFAANEYFTDTTLEKEFFLEYSGGQMGVSKAVATEINWQAGKNVTVRTVTKKQRHKGGKGTRTVTRQQPQDSFFNFFKSVDPSTMDEEEVDERQDEVEQEYEMAQEIRHAIVPHPASYFMGDVDAGGFYDDYDDDDDDDGDDDDDDDDDEHHGRGHGHGRGGRRNDPMMRALSEQVAQQLNMRGAGAGAEKPECKQQ